MTSVDPGIGIDNRPRAGIKYQICPVVVLAVRYRSEEHDSRDFRLVHTAVFGKDSSDSGADKGLHLSVIEEHGGKNERKLTPLAYPAIADRHVVSALVRAARQHEEVDHHVGLLVTIANFYPSDILPAPWKKYAGYGVLGTEMELSALLVLSAMHGAQAGGLAASDGNLVRVQDPGMEGYDPHREVVARGKQAMLQIALEALSDLAGP